MYEAGCSAGTPCQEFACLEPCELLTQEFYDECSRQYCPIRFVDPDDTDCLQRNWGEYVACVEQQPSCEHYACVYILKICYA